MAASSGAATTTCVRTSAERHRHDLALRYLEKLPGSSLQAGRQRSGQKSKPEQFACDLFFPPLRMLAKAEAARMKASSITLPPATWQCSLTKDEAELIEEAASKAESK